MPEVSSSMIARVEFNEEKDGRPSALIVQFKKNLEVGAYDGVPKELYDAMLTAASPGKFLNAEIKGVYPYRRIS